MDRVEIQEGLLFRKLPKRGCELFAKDGYHFYDKANESNYDENGNLLSEEELLWFTYMTSLCETKEQVNANVVSVPIQDNY